MIFASASQDLIEPATSRIVAAKLGLTAPAMDIKNACNSVINAVQVAEALIASRQYRRVLIAIEEQPSHAVHWQVRDQEQFIRSFPGYTMSDGGPAVILEATDDAGTGILDSSFVAVSTAAEPIGDRVEASFSRGGRADRRQQARARSS